MEWIKNGFKPKFLISRELLSLCIIFIYCLKKYLIVYRGKKKSHNFASLVIHSDSIF